MLVARVLDEFLRTVTGEGLTRVPLDCCLYTVAGALAEASSTKGGVICMACLGVARRWWFLSRASGGVYPDGDSCVIGRSFEHQASAICFSAKRLGLGKFLHLPSPQVLLPSL